MKTQNYFCYYVCILYTVKSSSSIRPFSQLTFWHVKVGSTINNINDGWIQFSFSNSWPLYSAWWFTRMASLDTWMELSHRKCYQCTNCAFPASTSQKVHMNILYAPCYQEWEINCITCIQKILLFSNQTRCSAVMAVNAVLYLFLINIVYFEWIFS